MAFTEKSAWVMLIALLVSGAYYAQLVAGLSAAVDGLAPPIVPTIVLYTGLLVAIAVIGHFVIAIGSPADANAPLDERDQQVLARAGHWSSYVVSGGVIVALGAYLLTADGALLFYAVFASLMLGQVVEYLLQLVFYRYGL